MARRRSLVTVVAAAALVAGVLWVRDGTAAVEADLAGPPPSPVPAPSAADGATDGLVVSANGVEGLRLGTSAPTEQFGPSTPDGCTLTWPPPERIDVHPGVDVVAWALDGDVVSVTVASWDVLESVDERVRTWLGPTLGSPIQAAAELPGARQDVTRVSPDGPTVTVVTVPGRGVEVVYSDVPTWAGPGTPETTGRVTTIEVRHPVGRGCVAADDPEQFGAGGGTTGVLDLDGLEHVRIGDDVDALVAAGHLLEEIPSGGIPDDPAPGGCRAFSTVAAPWARVTALEDRVAKVQTWSPDVRTSFGVQGGAGLEEIRAQFPDLYVAEPTSGLGDLVWQVDGTTVSAAMWPATMFVPDVDRAFQAGPPVVHAVSVTAPGVEAWSADC